MAKNDMNANFENLKAEMIKKKSIATSINENKQTSESENTKEDINQDKNDYVNANKDVNIVSENDKDATISSNKIVIKKAAKVQPPKRITYYLNHDTIKKIEKYSKLTGMGKSELVQKLLDLSLDNLEVQS